MSQVEVGHVVERRYGRVAAAARGKSNLVVLCATKPDKTTSTSNAPCTSFPVSILSLRIALSVDFSHRLKLALFRISRYAADLLSQDQNQWHNFFKIVDGLETLSNFLYK
ncbi:hypothetical protein [Octadecabacter antarcticus]|uniref:hypothetical protein n=1 Tax=Octadecabacter antarcticus TaxID=1217908 RepID=UPI0005C55F24|nr:hypothetical protein [Octadecabacter antarcticus]